MRYLKQRCTRQPQLSASFSFLVNTLCIFHTTSYHRLVGHRSAHTYAYSLTLHHCVPFPSLARLHIHPFVMVPVYPPSFIYIRLLDSSSILVTPSFPLLHIYITHATVRTLYSRSLSCTSFCPRPVVHALYPNPPRPGRLCCLLSVPYILYLTFLPYLPQVAPPTNSSSPPSLPTITSGDLHPILHPAIVSLHPILAGALE